MTHSEFAVIKDNGIKNDYRVNFELVNSKAYHDKFIGLTEHKALDEATYCLSSSSGNISRLISAAQLRLNRHNVLCIERFQ